MSVYILSLLMVMAASTAVVRLARRLLARRSRMLLATLALSGFFWALPMRHNVAQTSHDYEGLYYLGVPLVLYSLLLLYVHERWGHRPVAGLAVAALLAFVASTFQMDRDRRWRIDARAAEPQKAAMAELGTIRETVRGKVVLLLPSVKPEWYRQAGQQNYRWDYYLAGSVLAYRLLDMEIAGRDADFVVSRDRVESDALLTPHNERVFLYAPAGMDELVELYRATHQRVVSAGEPAARSRFDVYLRDGRLFYVKDPCVREDVRNYGVFVRVFPEDPEDLSRRDRRYGWEELRLRFQQTGGLFEGKCMAILPLPDHPISVIRTGQRPNLLLRREGVRGWEVEIPARR